MKIIGKKDYYDYGAKYGIDPQVVLDRREWFDLPMQELAIGAYNVYLMDLLFCGQVHTACVSRGREKIWWNEEISEIAEITSRSWLSRESKYNVFKFKKGYKGNSNYRSIFKFGQSPEENARRRCPLLGVIYYGRHSYDILPVSNLKELKFARVMPPLDAFNNIYNFMLAQKDKLPKDHDILTDKEKISSHGLSTKTSFRGS